MCACVCVCRKGGLLLEKHYSVTLGKSLGVPYHCLIKIANSVTCVSLKF